MLPIMRSEVFCIFEYWVNARVSMEFLSGMKCARDAGGCVFDNGRCEFLRPIAEWYSPWYTRPAAYKTYDPFSKFNKIVIFFFFSS